MILNEALPLVEPFVADDVPYRRSRLDRLTGLFSLYHEHALKLSSLLHGFQFFRCDVRWAVRQIRVECYRFELKTFDANDVGTLLSLAAGSAEPVLVSEEQIF